MGRITAAAIHRVASRCARVVPVVASLAAAGACRTAASTTTTAAVPGAVTATVTATAPSAAPPTAVRFGDTTTLGLHLLSLDARAGTATVALGREAWLVVLLVTPGRDIVLLSPDPEAPAQRAGARRHALRLAPSAPPGTRTIAGQGAYDACMREGERRIARRVAAVEAADAAARRRARTDTLGRRIEPSPSTTVVNEAAELQALDRACRQRAQVARDRSAPPGEAPPAGERYLVVLVADARLEGAMISERLGTLAVTASDVRTTIEAVAAGLYVGTGARVAGLYVAH